MYVVLLGKLSKALMCLI